LAGRRSVAGSYFGGIKETQEMMDFAAEHNVRPEIEIIPMDYVNTAMERLLKADVKYRFVIDVGNTLKSYPSTTLEWFTFNYKTQSDNYISNSLCDLAHIFYFQYNCGTNQLLDFIFSITLFYFNNFKFNTYIKFNFIVFK